MSQREAIRQTFLLLLKAMSSVGGDTGLFEIEANGWKGFQFDDPEKLPKRIALELYDSQDRHVEIILFRAQNTPKAGITQADINRVVETLRAVDQPTAQTAVSRGDTVVAK